MVEKLPKALFQFADEDLSGDQLRVACFKNHPTTLVESLSHSPGNRTLADTALPNEQDGTASILEKECLHGCHLIQKGIVFNYRIHLRDFRDVPNPTDGV